MNSIRARLLIVMLLIVTLSLGIMGGINYWKTSMDILTPAETMTSLVKRGTNFPLFACRIIPAGHRREN